MRMAGMETATAAQCRWKSVQNRCWRWAREVAGGAASHLATTPHASIAAAAKHARAMFGSWSVSVLFVCPRAHAGTGLYMLPGPELVEPEHDSECPPSSWTNGKSS